MPNKIRAIRGEKKVTRSCRSKLPHSSTMSTLSSCTALGFLFAASGSVWSGALSRLASSSAEQPTGKERAFS